MTVREGRFICSFDNVDRFPFGEQVCGFKFWIMGTDNLLTQLRLEKLTYLGGDTVKQYSIREWWAAWKENVGNGTIRLNAQVWRRLLHIFLQWPRGLAILCGPGCPRHVK